MRTINGFVGFTVAMIVNLAMTYRRPPTGGGNEIGSRSWHFEPIDAFVFGNQLVTATGFPHPSAEQIPER